MPRSNFAATRLAIVLSLLAVARSDAADPLMISPAACRPGTETVLRVTGPGVDGELRALCSLDASSLVIEEATEGAADLRLSVPEDAAPGPIGLWLATKDGPLPPITLMVDDLPTVVPESDHRSVDSAQTLASFACLSGISRASGSDHYRIPLVAGQRVAFEVLTQPLGSSMEPVVSLRDRHGKQLLRFDNDGIGPGCRFEFRAPEEADYSLEIHDNQFRGGLRYHLRVGDFPIVRHASPMGVRVGKTTSVTAVSDDGDAFGPTKFVSEERPDGSPGIATVMHPVRRPGGQSDAWVPLHVSPYPQVASKHGEPMSGPFEIPSVVHGRLVEPGHVVRHRVRGQPGKSVRFGSRTHTLGSLAWLRMRLRDGDGRQVASTDDSDGEEPQLTYVFEDDEVYTLEVTDLFGRGGPGFAYLIEAVLLRPLTIRLRGDPAVRRDLTLPAGGGVSAVDVELPHGPPESEVELQLTGDHRGLRIVNPRIPLGAAKARIFLIADEAWDEQSMSSVGLRAMDADTRESATVMSTAAWERKRRPEILRPLDWSEGRLLVVGTKAADPPFDVRMTSPADFDRGSTRYEVSVELSRRDGDWKGDLMVFGDQLPDGWEVEVTRDGETYSVLWTREARSLIEVERLPLRFIAEIDGRHFARTLIVEPNWSDPLTALEVHPSEVALSGPRSRWQLVVDASGERTPTRDRTRDARIRSADPSVADVRGAVVFPISNGNTEIVVELGGHRRTIPVTVRELEADPPVAFESEVLAALSKQGCNSGACHGSPSGKGSFRLSLRGFDPELDALTLTREGFGRRVNPPEPERSLLLLKPLMKVVHGGGKRIAPTDEAYRILRDWIDGGARPDPPGVPRCESLRVYPSTQRVATIDAGPQQIAVTARFDDGTLRDVTHLAVYESSDERIATVDASGSVHAHARGEAVILVRFLEHVVPATFMFNRPSSDFVWRAPPARNEIDPLVYEKLRQTEFLPAKFCSDEVFVRRVFLDLIGVPPTVEEVQTFIRDERPDKRRSLVDELLEREAFAKFWALKWGDWLKMTSARLGTSGVYNYHRWVEQAFRENLPYDEFARQLLTATGSTRTNPAANFYRAAEDLHESVETASQVFLGARIQCAKCHNHPFERWTQDNYYGLAAFFRRVDRRDSPLPGELLIASADEGEVTQPRTGKIARPWLPYEGIVRTDPTTDRREVFADWLIDPRNPLFAKVETNRIWAQFFARGLVDPIDDFRTSNPPSNQAVLETLTDEFVASGFDRKHLIRRIVNSGTYQASHRSDEHNRDDIHYFSHQLPRRLSAEQLFDAIHQTLGLVADLRPLPPGTRATHLPAPDLVGVDFLKVLGQPTRSTVCACERSNDSNLAMAIELLNGELVHDLLRDPKSRFRRSLAAGDAVADAIDQLYLAALARLPSDDERSAAIEHCESRDDPALGLEDLCWALFNTDEFLFQH